MKKLLVIALLGFVSACACFECDDEIPVTSYQSSRQEKLDCDYFDGKTCYRYIYKKKANKVAKPAPIRYRKCNDPKPSCGGCKQVAPCNSCNTCNSCNSCGTKVSETREPVEIVYKKTTYKTVYEPKTYSQISYEKVPYNSVAEAENIEVVEGDAVLLEDDL